MHFLETYLASVLYVPIPGGLVVSPGSVVLFAGKLVMLLLLYIREDAAAVRQPIYGLFLGNLLIVGLVLVLRHHIVPSAAATPSPDFSFMDEMGWLMVWGTALLFLDSLFIILLYERLGGWLGKRTTLRIIVSAAIVLSFDQLGFFAALYTFVGVPVSVLYSGWIAKMGAALFYGTLTGLYLRFMEGRRMGVPARRNLSDVFDMLTYRERYEALLRQTGRDALTGVFDRGSFDRDAGKMIAEAQSHGRPVSLLVVDIDHFKRINDRYGHAAGDEALRLIAEELGRGVREGDRVYRYGGEEFIVVCDGLPHMAAVLAGERLRFGIAGLSLGAGMLPITASIGIATGSEDGTDLATLFQCADKRLYMAKSAGRDRVMGRKAPQTRPVITAGMSRAG
jgi:diguanylate cyclase (GGDEF)-like protein